VLLGWYVNTDGRAESVEVIDSSFHNPDAERCMTRQIAVQGPLDAMPIT
jgi:hypothetical protein